MYEVRTDAVRLRIDDKKKVNLEEEGTESLNINGRVKSEKFTD